MMAKIVDFLRRLQDGFAISEAMQESGAELADNNPANPLKDY